MIRQMNCSIVLCRLMTSMAPVSVEAGLGGSPLRIAPPDFTLVGCSLMYYIKNFSLFNYCMHSDFRCVQLV
jgi:hypothetical protein